ncbi:MAG: phage N-6-adenine-methyltransferase [Clostridia bacterium]|nr:phage N-6-adenine-methyltransferase [Clostridia bacterium]
MNKALFSSNRMDWETPDDLFERVNKEFRFTLDAASSHENAKCKRHYTEKEDGLSKNWGGETVWVNPPYGKELPKWIQKCAQEGRKQNTTVVMLIPARTDTKAFHEHIYGRAEIRFIKGRLKFKGAKTGAPFPSMLVVFRGETE